MYNKILTPTEFTIFSYVAVDGLCTMLVDLKPHFFYKSKTRRPLFVASACLVHFLCGLPMLTKGGIYVFQVKPPNFEMFSNFSNFQLFDKFGASGLTLLWVGFFQVVVISWIYGCDEYYDNLYDMFGHKINIRKGPWRIIGYVLWKVNYVWNIESPLNNGFKISFQFVTPILCVMVFFYYLVTWESTKYDKTYIYPMWGEVLGLCLALSSMLAVPGQFIVSYIRSPGATFKEVLVG